MWRTLRIFSSSGLFIVRNPIMCCASLESKSLAQNCCECFVPCAKMTICVNPGIAGADIDGSDFGPNTSNSFISIRIRISSYYPTKCRVSLLSAGEKVRSSSTSLPFHSLLRHNVTEIQVPHLKIKAQCGFWTLCLPYNQHRHLRWRSRLVSTNAPAFS